MSVWLFAIPTILHAQTTGAGRISNGDVVRVDVTGHPELSQTVTVDQQGSLTLSSVGSIRAAGRSTDDLAADIARRIALTQRETPQVRVTILESHGQRIYVLGAVILPGVYSFRQDPTLWEAISEAGGASDDADLSAVEVVPGVQGERAASTFDVAAAIRTGDYGSLPKLKPGDTVRVPRLAGVGGAGQVVFIMGAVSAQGPLALAPPGDLVSTVIRSAPSADADLKRIEIVRRVGSRIEQMRVNAHEYISEARADGNPPLLPGDTIYVPRRVHKFNPLTLIGIVTPVIGLVTSIVLLAR